MKPVKSEFTHLPSMGVYGDCYRACIASILEMKREDVPHFLENNPSDDEFWNRRQKWFKEQGLARIFLMYQLDAQEFMKNYNPGIYYILSGVTVGGTAHSVVCIDGEQVHDPSNVGGIVKPMIHYEGDDDSIEKMYYIEFFAHPISMRKE